MAFSVGQATFPPRDTKRIKPSWDEYFLNISHVVASRSSCLRNQVGAVIAKDKRILSTGYNGAPQHQESSLDKGWCFRDQHHISSFTHLELCRAVGSHAESNAIALAARNGTATDGATIYVTGHQMICNQCRAIIANAGITRVVLRRPDGVVLEFAPECDWTVHPVDQMTEGEIGENLRDKSQPFETSP